MAQYLLSIMQPDGGPPDPEAMQRIGAALHRVNEELHENESWVFTGGLHGPHSASVVGADGLITDGPYVETKEHVGGIYVIAVDDLDAALHWARRVAAATTLPVEVRPFQDVDRF